MPDEDRPPLDRYRGFTFRLPGSGRPTHTPVRPTWTCNACGQEWPCRPARAALRGEYANFPTVLAIYLSGQYTVAVDDLAMFGTIPQNLYTRIVGWCR